MKSKVYKVFAWIWSIVCMIVTFSIILLFYNATNLPIGRCVCIIDIAVFMKYLVSRVKSSYKNENILRRLPLYDKFLLAVVSIPIIFMAMIGPIIIPAAVLIALFGLLDLRESIFKCIFIKSYRKDIFRRSGVYIIFNTILCEMASIYTFYHP